MTAKRVYECNLCHKGMRPEEEDQGFGLRWGSVLRLTEDWREEETHICIECYQAIRGHDAT